MLGLIGKKVGMTRKFTEDGQSISVTVLEVMPATIVQIKTEKSDGYNAIQLVAGNRKLSRVSKPEAGHLLKAGTDTNKILKEFRMSSDEVSSYSVGQQINVDLFNDVKYVDVQSKSKGKGFQGGVKRHNFRTQDATHGNSLSHRAIGSTGQNQTPGRVFKGKKMPGQMGNVQVTVQNLAVVEVSCGDTLSDHKQGQVSYVLLAGGVPGAKGSEVIITPAVKKIRSAA